MRWLMIGITGLAASGMANAQTREIANAHVRKVELITMTATPPVPDRAAEPGPDTLADAGLAPEASFRVHDLSRRWVEFQMASGFVSRADMTGQGFARQSDGMTGTPVPGGAAPTVAPTSSIGVPAWMRDGPVFAAAAPRYTPGCGISSYRLTGFLGADAEARRASYFGTMARIACDFGIPVGLFDAMIIQESRYQPNIVSPKNAFGLTQLMPGTAIALGVNRYHPEDNLRGGAKYLRQQLDRFGHPHLALAAYNAGPGRVRGGLVPRIAETQDYVVNVLANWSRLTGTGRSVTVLHPGERPTQPPGRRAAVSTF